MLLPVWLAEKMFTRCYGYGMEKLGALVAFLASAFVVVAGCGTSERTCCQPL
jgi:divalent metal cation (Fe/Co/Zn/Cd) transporter